MTQLRPAALAEMIAVEISRQGQEHDGLGDAESIVLMGEAPTINLVELAEAVLRWSQAPVEVCKGMTFARETLLAHGCECPQPSAPAALRCQVCPLGAVAPAPRGCGPCGGPAVTRELSCGAPSGVRIEQRCADCPARPFELGAGLA
jgi:hypothetical protein